MAPRAPFLPRPIRRGSTFRVSLREVTGRDLGSWLRYAIWAFLGSLWTTFGAISIVANSSKGVGAISIVANSSKGGGTFGFLRALREGARLEPKRPGRDDQINSSALPPSRFVAAAVDPAMVPAA